MARISDALIAEIEEDIRTRPIQPGEFRSLEGMGSYYFSSDSHSEDEAPFASFLIDGTRIFLFRKRNG